MRLWVPHVQYAFQAQHWQFSNGVPYQLAVTQASLRGSGTRSSFHPLLFALCWPSREHGGLDGERRFPKILVLQSLVGADPLGGAVGKESNSERWWAWFTHKRQNSLHASPSLYFSWAAFFIFLFSPLIHQLHCKTADLKHHAKIFGFCGLLSFV